MRSLTVLYDAGCPVCRAARLWVSAQRQLVPVSFEAAGSSAIRRRFPFVDPEQSRRDITVIGLDERGTAHVFSKERAWIMVLWSLSGWRDRAFWLAQPGHEGLAKGIATGGDKLRRWFSADQPAGGRFGDDQPYAEPCGEACATGPTG